MGGVRESILSVPAMFASPMGRAATGPAPNLLAGGQVVSERPISREEMARTGHITQSSESTRVGGLGGAASYSGVAVGRAGGISGGIQGGDIRSSGLASTGISGLCVSASSPLQGSPSVLGGNRAGGFSNNQFSGGASTSRPVQGSPSVLGGTQAQVLGGGISAVR